MGHSGRAVRSPLGSLAAGVGSAARRAVPRNAAPLPYVPRRGGGAVSATSGETGLLGATGSNGTLFSIINTLSTDTASVEWHLHAINRVRSGSMCPECDMEGVRMVPAHPALTVLNRPNDFFTRQELFESVQQHIDLVGEGWLAVSWLGGRPVELWPVRPDRMAPVRDPKNYLTGYVYRSPDGQLIPLKREEVIFIRVPAPWDAYRGAGAVQTLVNQLWGAQYAAEWNRKFFENSALPGGLIELPINLSDEQWEEFQNRWAETHKGVNNAHTVGMLEYGGKWVDLRYTQRDMEFVELRRVTREEVREAFGVHGHILGMSESVNRANAEAADYTHAKRKVVPRCDRWKGALNNDFLRLFGDMGNGYQFHYTSPVPEDKETTNAERLNKAQAFKTLRDAGMSVEDAAMLVGYPPGLTVDAPPAATSAPGNAESEMEDGAPGEGAEMRLPWLT